jgi:hypothetical protein
VHIQGMRKSLAFTYGTQRVSPFQKSCNKTSHIQKSGVSKQFSFLGVLKSYKPILSTVFLSFLNRERDFANFSDRLYVHYDRS